MSKPDAPVNAFRRPPVRKPGCTHQLGCRCEAPYWLRPSAPAEIAIEERIASEGKVVQKLVGKE